MRYKSHLGQTDIIFVKARSFARELCHDRTANQDPRTYTNTGITIPHVSITLTRTATQATSFGTRRNWSFTTSAISEAQRGC